MKRWSYRDVNGWHVGMVLSYNAISIECIIYSRWPATNDELVMASPSIIDSMQSTYQEVISYLNRIL